jgi:carnitine O-acetyltransferase
MIEYSKINEKSLTEIENGIFALVIEDYSPKNRNDYCRMLLCGDGGNRWFDKSVQIVVAQNGDAGINQEHSGYDGHSILKLAQFCINHWTKNSVPNVSNISFNETFEPLAWDLSEKTFKDIQSASKNTQEFFNTVDVSVLDFDDYGKKFASSNGFSPDAFIQIAFQLAFFRHRHHVGSTYESANTKQFYHGRTETIRSCSKDSKLFCELFSDSSASSKDKFAAFQKACKTHGVTTNNAKNGQGVDRHLYGMHQLAKLNVLKFPNYRVPEIYKDKAYSLMKTDLLSTSNVSGAAALNLFTFGATSSQGFGLGYIVEDNCFRVACSSFVGEAAEFTDVLRQTLRDIKILVSQNSTPKAKI